jgi:hypothetical protein
LSSHGFGGQTNWEILGNCAILITKKPTPQFHEISKSD